MRLDRLTLCALVAIFFGLGCRTTAAVYEPPRGGPADSGAPIAPLSTAGSSLAGTPTPARSSPPGAHPHVR